MFSQSTISPTETNPLRSIVIIGAGIIGMELAVLLLKQGAESITIVDSRLGEDTRSGSMVSIAFSEISRVTGLTVSPSPAKHIKDVHKTLYPFLQTQPITMIKGEFVDITHQQVVIQTGSTQVSLPCHVLYDCSGTQRVVLHKLNSFYYWPVFTIQPVGTTLVKHHIHARLIMNEADATAFNRVTQQEEYEIGSHINDLVGLSELRRLGWKFSSKPHAYIHTSPIKCKPDGTRPYALHMKKCEFYTEAPANLTLAQQKQFIAVLLKLFNGKTVAYEYHAPSKKRPAKPVLSYFTVEPQQTSPTHYQDKQRDIVVMHCGDATLNLPYSFGLSVTLGSQRLKLLVDATRIKDGAIAAIDIQYYQQEMKSRNAFAKFVFNKHDNYNKNRLTNDHARILQLLKPVLQHGTNRATQQIVEQAYHDIEKEHQSQTLFRSTLTSIANFSLWQHPVFTRMQHVKESVVRMTNSYF